MGYSQFYHKTKHLIISLLLLLLLASTFTQGRLITETPQKLGRGIGEEKIMVVRIGSRPPRCDKRCSSCAHCVAVQVPVNTQTHSKKTINTHMMSNMLYSRSGDISNYKPMSWKCKCGNIIFNP